MGTRQLINSPSTLIIVATLLAGLVGCTSRLRDVPLGKVVVYRNGVAYFERYATVTKGELSLLVARTKVDDLLKSLKVQDAMTGRSLPISFPSRDTHDKLVRMIIRVPGAGTRRVKLSYTSESPAWKPSYRLTLLGGGQVGLQGWAVVDNVSGEDWNDVIVSVGSSAALSFRYDLWSVRDVHRQTLGEQQRLATAPPTATGIITAGRSKGTRSKAPTRITLDQNYVQNIPVPGRTFSSALGSAPGTTSDSLGVSFSGATTLENQYVIDGINTTLTSYGSSRSRPTRRSRQELEEERKRRELYARQRREARAEAAKMKRTNDRLARQLLGSSATFVIEGVASPSRRDGQVVARSMANHLRNELIRRGVSPGKLLVRTRTGAVGEPTSLRLVPADPAQAPAKEGPAVGESKFVSRTPVSIPNQRSSMVSFVNHRTSGRPVYLYDALSPRGNKSYAFKAIRFRNPTSQYLEGGPITVFGDSTFIGEGLIEAMAPGETALLPYALDKLVYVEREQSFADVVVGFERIVDRGAIVRKRRESTTRLSLHNRSQHKITVFVRHDTDRGWKLRKGPPNLQRLGRMSVFPVELAAGEHRQVSLSEVTPITAALDLTTPGGIAQLETYLRGNRDPAFVKAARALIAAHRSIARKLETIDTTAGQLALYRDRLDELHAQVVTLEAVRSKTGLLRHLNRRMEQMSDKVQQAVVRIVTLRDQLMVERLAYHDLLLQLANRARR